MTGSNVAPAMETQSHHARELPSTLLESQSLQSSSKCAGDITNKEAANLKRAQDVVRLFAAGNMEDFVATAIEDVKGSMFSGLIPAGDSIGNKMELAKALGQIDEYIEPKRCEPCNWRAVGDDVLFNVVWEFIWRATGETITTTGLARIVLRSNMICEIYHMVDVEQVTGSPQEESSAVKRAREIVAELATGQYDRYIAMLTDDVKASMLGGLIQGADTISNNTGFKSVLDNFDAYMDIKTLTPCNFQSLPNNDVMYNVEWEFEWKPSGKLVTATAVVRDVLRGDMLAETYHMVDVKQMSRGWYHM